MAGMTAYVNFAGRYDQMIAQSRAAGVAAGTNVTTGFTAAFKKFAAPVAIAALGTSAFKLGETFKQSFNTIRVGTGQTGAAFEQLKDDFKAVAATRPTGFNLTAEAITELNKRLGLSGKPLRDLSTQFLRLSGITKTDLKTNIASVTRAFGDWEVATEDQGKTLDLFFRASQASGASVDELASKVVQFGAPLRQVGFSLEESTAMFAQFEKAGVNTQTMMPGLRQALGRFLAEGRDPAEALRESFEGIASGAISGEAALDIFGRRAGADMVEAIQQGRFNLDEFTASIVNGSDSIEQAAKDTSTLAGKLGTLRNRVLIGMEPIATRAYEAVNTGLANLIPIAGTAAGALGEVFSVLVEGDFTGAGPFAEDSPIIGGLFRVREAVLDITGAIADRLQPIWERFTSFLNTHASTAWAALAAAIGSLLGPLAIGGLLSSLGWLAGALVGVVAALATPATLIAGLAAGFVIAYQKIEPFRAAVDGVADAIQGGLQNAWAWLSGVDWAGVWTSITDAMQPFADAARWLHDEVVQPAWAGIVAAGQWLVAWATGVDWAGIFGDGWDVVQAAWDSVTAGAVVVRDALKDAWDYLFTVDWQGVWDDIASKVDTAADAVGRFVAPLTSPLIDAFTSAFTSIDWDAMTIAVTGAAGALAVLGSAIAPQAAIAAALTGGAVLAYTKLDAVRGAIDGIVDWFGNIEWDTVLETLDDLARPMVEAFGELGGSLVELAGPLWDLVSALGEALAPVLKIVWPVVKVLGVALAGVAWVMNKVFIFQIQAAAAIIGWVADKVLPALTWVIEHVVTPVIGALVDYWLWAWGKVGEVIGWVWEHVIRPVWDLISTYITEFLIPAYSTLWDVVSTVWSAISGAIQWAWGLIQPILGAVVAFIRDEVQWRFELFKETATTVWETVSGAVATAWDVMKWIFESIKGGITGVKDWISDRVDDIVGFFDGIGERIGDLADVLSAPFKTAFELIRGFWNNTVGKIDLNFTVPDIPGVPGRGETFGFDGSQYLIPPLPEFHRGGIIPGTRGREVDIRAMAGELVVDTATTKSLLSGGLIDYRRLAEAVAAALAAQPPVINMDGQIVSDQVNRRQGASVARFRP